MFELVVTSVVSIYFTAVLLGFLVHTFLMSGSQPVKLDGIEGDAIALDADQSLRSRLNKFSYTFNVE